jgi:hypothetical protein
MSACQICGRKIKDKFGVVAHHGYKRRQGEWQTDSCMGARHFPYEKSRDVIPEAIQSIQLYIKLKEEIIKQVEIEKVAVPSISGKNFIKSTDALYKVRQKEYLAKLRYEVKRAKLEMERLQKRFNAWKEIKW